MRTPSCPARTGRWKSRAIAPQPTTATRKQARADFSAARVSFKGRAPGVCTESCVCIRLIFGFLSEGPHQWGDQDRNDPDHQVQWDADTDVVGKAIASWTVDHQVGLGAYRHGKGAGGR